MAFPPYVAGSRMGAQNETDILGCFLTLTPYNFPEGYERPIRGTLLLSNLHVNL